MSKLYTLSLIIALLIFTRCTKDKDEATPDYGVGEYTIAGKTYGGNCVQGGIVSLGPGVNVTIYDPKYVVDQFTIMNLSTASSGTFTFKEGKEAQIEDTYGIGGLDGKLIVTKPGGSITKTGANSFTFTGTVYTEDGNEYSITGSGKYK